MRTLKSKVLSKALYGVEATQLPDGTIKQLQAAALDAAGRFRTRRRSPAFALYAADLPGLDARIEITKRRVCFLKRRIELDPGTLDIEGDNVGDLGL